MYGDTYTNMAQLKITRDVHSEMCHTFLSEFPVDVLGFFLCRMITYKYTLLYNAR